MMFHKRTYTQESIHHSLETEEQRNLWNQQKMIKE